ncbi:MAG: glycosyltransferase family 2 protein [Acidimicrobiia bacterium]
MKVAVVVPNWNGEPLLARCLDSLSRQTMPVDVIVADNGSTDASVQIAAERGAQVLELGRNTGFTGAVNAGIAAALEQGADYVLLLNNDATAEPTWVEALVSAAERDPLAAVVAGKLVQPGPERLLDSAGSGYSTWGFPFPRGRNEVDSGQYDGPVAEEIATVTAGATLYRAAALRDISVFDDDFFAYYEDDDICFRARLRGWRVLYEPRAVVEHEIAATSSRLGDLRSFHMVKNFFLLFHKNMPGRLWWRHLPSFVIGWLWFSAITARDGDRRAVLRAWWWTVKHLPATRAKRRSIQQRRSATDAEIGRLLLHAPPPTSRLGRRLARR